MIGFFTDLYHNPAQLSFEAIATAMNEEFGTTLTRNACIGKSHRLNLPLRGVNVSRQRKTSTGDKKMRRKTVRIDAPIAPVEAIIPDAPPSEGLTILQLREGDCKWPLGETYARPPFQYCGEPSLLGRSYCVTHMAKATGGRT